jgi:SAM-dependent methyltransferase
MKRSDKDGITLQLKERMESAHLQALRDEEIGVRHRILQFYLPLFLSHASHAGKLPEAMRVLDCGCGNGASVEYLASAGFEAYGIDSAPFRVEQWHERTKLPRVHLLKADAASLPFPDSYFDIVFSCGMLEHIGVAEECTPSYRVTPLPRQAELRQNFLAESMRVLKAHGTVYIDHPNGSFPVDFWHNDYRSLPRFHLPSEKFLPSFREVAGMARMVAPGCSVEAISPAGRFALERARRRWYGKLFSSALLSYLELMKRPPFVALAASPLNPYLVIRIAS